MKPSQLLHADPDTDEAVVLTAIDSGMIRFVGSSFPASADPGDVVHTVIMRPQEEYEVVALVVERGGVSCPLLLQVTQDGGCRIFLDEPFSCGGGVLPQLGLNGQMRVRVLGEPQVTLTTNPVEACTKEYIYIADTNLLCRFLVEKVKLEDVIRSLVRGPLPTL